VPGGRISLGGDPVGFAAPGQLGAGGDRGGQLVGVLVGPLGGVAGRSGAQEPGGVGQLAVEVVAAGLPGRSEVAGEGLCP